MQLPSRQFRPPPPAVLPHNAQAGGYRPADCRVTPHGILGATETANGLWAASGLLPADTTLAWSGAQGDQAVLVLAGALVLDGVTAGEGDAVLIDAGAAATVRAVEEARIVHFGSHGGPPTGGPFGPADGCGRARVVTAAQASARVSEGPDGARFTLRYFADGSDAHGRAALFTVSVDGASFGPPHSHSQDELIHVLDGIVRSGTLRVAPGETLAVARAMRYSFRTGGPARFVNFRRDASFITIKHERWLETVAARDGR